jgi:hypothetical protein
MGRRSDWPEFVVSDFYRRSWKSSRRDSKIEHFLVWFSCDSHCMFVEKIYKSCFEIEFDVANFASQR